MKGRLGGFNLTVVAAIALSAAMLSSLVAPTWSHYVDTTNNGVNAFSAAESYYRAEVTADAPVSYFRLSEVLGTTAVDERGISNGTYASGYTLGVADALANDGNTAVDFDGTSGRVSVPDAPALQLSTTVSIEAWVRPDTLTGPRWIVNKGNQYRLHIQDGTTYFGIRTPAGTDLNVTTTLVATASWQHVVGTFDGTTMVLYRNGENVGQASFTDTIQTATAPLFIGALDDTSGFFDGGIDEVAVYGNALTAARVLTHYRRGALTQP